MPTTSRATCKTKKAYASGRDANASEWFQRRYYGKRYRYICNVCGKWHLTKRAQKNEQMATD
jgi:hypothetical protein